MSTKEDSSLNVKCSILLEYDEFTTIATLKFTYEYWLSLNVFIIKCACKFSSTAIMRLIKNVILNLIGVAYNVSTLTLRWINTKHLFS